MSQLIATPVHDSYMDYGSPDTNYGPSITIAQGVLLAGGQKDTVLRGIANFDVSAIPPQAAIIQAKMQRIITLADDSPHTVYIARCTRPTQWTENGVTWHKYDGTNAWTSGGGDKDATTPPIVSFVEATEPDPHEVTGLGGFVRDALDLRSGIISLIMVNQNEAPAQSERSIWLAGGFWQLVIDYDVTGEPGRRSLLVDASARRPLAPRAPSQGRPPSSPSRAKGGRQP